MYYKNRVLSNRSQSNSFESIQESVSTDISNLDAIVSTVKSDLSKLDDRVTNIENK